MTTATKSLTVRVSGELHQETVRIATSRGESLNSFVEHAIARAVREQADQEFYDAFTLLAEDAAESDVEFAIDAQTEAMNRA